MAAVELQARRQVRAVMPVIVDFDWGLAQKLAKDEHVTTANNCKLHLERERPLTSGQDSLSNVVEIVKEVSAGADRGVSVNGVVAAVMRFHVRHTALLSSLLTPSSSPLQPASTLRSANSDAPCRVCANAYITFTAQGILTNREDVDECVERLVSKADGLLSGAAHQEHDMLSGTPKSLAEAGRKATE